MFVSRYFAIANFKSFSNLELESERIKSYKLFCMFVSSVATHVLVAAYSSCKFRFPVKLCPTLSVLYRYDNSLREVKNPQAALCKPDLSHTFSS